MSFPNKYMQLIQGLISGILQSSTKHQMENWIRWSFNILLKIFYESEVHNSLWSLCFDHTDQIPLFELNRQGQFETQPLLFWMPSSEGRWCEFRAQEVVSVLNFPAGRTILTMSFWKSRSLTFTSHWNPKAWPSPHDNRKLFYANQASWVSYRRNKDSLETMPDISVK